MVYRKQDNSHAKNIVHLHSRPSSKYFRTLEELTFSLALLVLGEGSFQQGEVLVLEEKR